MRRQHLMYGLVLLLSSACWAATPSRMPTLVEGSRATVLLFVSSGCPCTDQHKLEIRKLVERTRSRGVAFYCVFSNINESDVRVAHFYRGIGWDFPYLLDSEAVFARRFGATRTPQAIVLNEQGGLLYRGPIDDSAANLGRVEHAYLADRVNGLLDKQAMEFTEVVPVGCWLVTAADLAKQ